MMANLGPKAANYETLTACLAQGGQLSAQDGQFNAHRVPYNRNNKDDLQRKR